MIVLNNILVTITSSSPSEAILDYGSSCPTRCRPLHTPDKPRSL